MSIDDQELSELTERSQDVHADAMRASKDPLAEMVELGHERRAGHDVDAGENQDFTERRNGLLGGSGLRKAGLFGSVGIGAALIGLLQRPAFADKATDIQTLQTAASIEALAVATYETALTLPFVGSLPDVVKTFVTTTKDQHAQHLQAFNSATTALGGKAQTQPDPALLTVVNQAKPGLTGPGPLVDLAIELENTAAQTYVANTAALEDQNAKKVTASVMGVEAQHVSILLAVKALLDSGLAAQIKLPPDLAALPAAAGSVGFPDSFYKTDLARNAAEGAVK